MKTPNPSSPLSEDRDPTSPPPTPPVGPVESDIEQSQESAEPAAAHSSAELTAVHEAAETLFYTLSKVDDGDIVADLVSTSLKLLRDSTNRGDMKLLNNSLKELRYSLKVFAPYHGVRKASIFGSARTPSSHPDYISALDAGKKLAAKGWMVITGAGGGIMEAGHGGAGAGPSFGLAIRLPFEQKTNPFIEGDKKLINFKYFFTRKLMFVRSSSAIIVYPGGFGTMDEAFEALTLIQTGKSVPCPVVFVDRPGGDYWAEWQAYVQKQLLDRKLISPHDLALYKITDNVDEAVDEVINFYRNYHSIRYVRDELVMRLEKKLTDEQVAYINANFKDILSKGEFRKSDALAVEKDEPTLAHLGRLIFTFNRRDHGRFRQLIDHVNTL